MRSAFREAIKALCFPLVAVGAFAAGVAILASGSALAASDDVAKVTEDVARARKVYEAGDYEQAIKLLKADANRYEAVTNGQRDENYAIIILLLSEAYRQAGHYADAEPLNKDAAEGIEVILGPDHPGLARALDDLGDVYYHEKRYAEAEPLDKRALAIREKAFGTDAPEVAMSLTNLAILYETEGRYSEAAPLSQRALAIVEKAVGRDGPEDAVSLNLMALIYDNLGRYADAEPLYKHALAVREKVLKAGDPDLAESAYNLGNLYREQGRYPEAEPLLKRALAIYEKALGPGDSLVASNLEGLAALYADQGRYGDAEPLNKRALAIREKALGAGDPEVARSLDNLASLYWQEGRYAEAEPLNKQALAIKEKALGPEHQDVALSINNLATLYREQRRYAEAEPLLERALAIYEKSSLGPDHPLVAAALGNLASVYRQQGRYAEAEPIARRALAIVEKALGPDNPEVASSLKGLADTRVDLGRYAEAEPLYKRALAIKQTALGPDHSEVASSLTDLARLYDYQSRYADALPLVRAATQIGTEFPKFHLATLDGARKAGLIADADAVGESFAAEQVGFSSAASDALSQLAVRFAAGSGDLARLVREEQDLATRLAQLDKAVIAEIAKALADRSKEREQALRDDLDKATKSLGNLRTELSSRFPDYIALSRPQRIALADAQSLLGEDEALVVFDLAQPDEADDPLSSVGYVWALTRKAAAWQKLAAKKGEITDEVTALRSELDPNGDKPFDANLSHQLYQQTFGAIAPVISGKHRLLVVLSGPLTSLPPQVLVAAEPNGKDLRSNDWLIRHYSVTVLPSISSLKLLASASGRSAAAKPMTGYGDPVFKREGAETLGATGLPADRSYGSFYRAAVADVDALRRGLPALPETADELKSVAKSVGADSADIKLGTAASVTAVKRARLDQYRIIYFATHALVAGEVERFAKIKAEPALALSLPDRPTEADDGLLKASEVAQLKLNADIVVLSACNTAAGDKPGAEALSGLARAFFYAGARSLIVSHWPVESDAAVRLMTSTFAAMAADKTLTPSQALRKSMLAMIDDPNDPDAANPSFWAPFVVVGEARSGR